MNTFYFSGSICRKQFLTDQYLSFWIVCITLVLKLNKPPHTFVRSINNTCRNFLYSMYCMESMDVALSSDFLFLFLKSTTIVTFCSPGHAYFKAATIALGWKEHWEKSCSFFCVYNKITYSVCAYNYCTSCSLYYLK